GFAIRNHYFVPGFPVMAWPMIEQLLDGELAAVRTPVTRAERSFLVYEMAESTVTPLMEAIERDIPGIRTFSLPSVGEDGSRRHIELGVKGDAGRIDEAFDRLRRGALALGGQIER
ncbi:MAG: competence/damage-inducible protein A, partial [Betaproteobacteria bacterium]